MTTLKFFTIKLKSKSVFSKNSQLFGKKLFVFAQQDIKKKKKIYIYNPVMFHLAGTVLNNTWFRASI